MLNKKTMQKTSLFSLCALSALCVTLTGCGAKYDSGTIKEQQYFYVYVGGNKEEFSVLKNASEVIRFFTPDGTLTIENMNNYPKYKVVRFEARDGTRINIDYETYHWEYSGADVSYCFYSKI